MPHNSLEDSCKCESATRRIEPATISRLIETVFLDPVNVSLDFARQLWSEIARLHSMNLSNVIADCRVEFLLGLGFENATLAGESHLFAIQFKHLLEAGGPRPI